jgi:hypothetical protein
MKNKYLLIASVTLFGYGFSQGKLHEKISHVPSMFDGEIIDHSLNQPINVNRTVMWSEDFSQGLESANGTWTRTGSDGNLWQRVTTVRASCFTPVTNPNFPTRSNGFMVFHSDSANCIDANAGTFNQNSYFGELVSPSIDFTGVNAAILNFRQLFRHCCFGSFQNQVAVSNDGGLNWTSFNVSQGVPVNESSGIQNKFVNITSVIANQPDVKIKFIWNATNVSTHYFWAIDDIEISVAPDNDLSVTKIWTHDIFNKYDYSITPTHQTVPYTIGAIVANDGGEHQANVPINVKLLKNGTEEVYSADFLHDFLIARVDTLWFDTGFEISEVGDYTISVTVPDDDNNSNNTTSAVHVVSSNSYAHDFTTNGIHTFNITNHEDEEYAYGNFFEVERQATIEGVYVKFETGTVSGAEVDIRLNMYDGAVNFIDQKIYYVQPADLKKTIFIPFDSPHVLEAGTLYVIEVRKNLAIGRISLGNSVTGNEDNSTYCYGPFGAGQAIGWYIGWNFSPALRMAFPECPDGTNISIVGTNTATTTTLSSVTGGTEPYTFWWQGPNNFSSNRRNLTELTSGGAYTVTVIDANNCRATATYNSVLSTQEIENTFINVYPNPTSGIVHFELSENVNGISITDIRGQLIETVKVQNKNTNLDVSSYADGVYFFQLTNSNGELLKTERFVVNK